MNKCHRGKSAFGKKGAKRLTDLPFQFPQDSKESSLKCRAVIFAIFDIWLLPEGEVLFR
jgi:hypothetical protein